MQKSYHRSERSEASCSQTGIDSLLLLFDFFFNGGSQLCPLSLDIWCGTVYCINLHLANEETAKLPQRLIEAFGFHCLLCINFQNTPVSIYGLESEAAKSRLSVI